MATTVATSFAEQDAEYEGGEEQPITYGEEDPEEGAMSNGIVIINEPDMVWQDVQCSNCGRWTDGSWHGKRDGDIIYCCSYCDNPFIANEPENCHIFSVANEWLQNLITNILNLSKEKILL